MPKGRPPLALTLSALFATLLLCWTIFTAQFWQLGNSFKGVGDGAGTGASGTDLLSVLLIGVIWLVLVSPYLCMAAGALNLITGKSLRVAYVYSLVVLVSFQRRLELMAMGNIVAGALWAFSFRGTGRAEHEPVQSQ